MVVSCGQLLVVKVRSKLKFMRACKTFCSLSTQSVSSSFMLPLENFLKNVLGNFSVQKLEYLVRKCKKDFVFVTPFPRNILG